MKKDEILKEFGNNLRAERNRKNLSQEELAEMADISDGQHLGKIENAKVNPTLTTVVSLLEALNIDFQTLLTSKDVINEK